MRLLAAVLLGAALLKTQAQIALKLDQPAAPDVVSLVEPQQVIANKQRDVELIFRVRKGLHINSHRPGLSYLLPTELKLEPVDGITVGKVRYPAGESYSFSFAPKEKLDVYTDLFRIHAEVKATHAGTFIVRGTLRYQSCDNASCFPPQTVPVKLEIDSK